jgi:hypothetical protein
MIRRNHSADQHDGSCHTVWLLGVLYGRIAIMILQTVTTPQLIRYGQPLGT